MGLFDLPVSELYNYQGLNPKPDDFDAYWQRALDEMNALDPSVALEPAYVHPAFECDDLYFTGTGGARIYAKFVIPKKAVFPVPAVLTFHGYTGSSADWSFLFNIAASGYAVAALDARGQGGKRERSGVTRVMARLFGAWKMMIRIICFSGTFSWILHCLRKLSAEWKGLMQTVLQFSGAARAEDCL